MSRRNLAEFQERSDLMLFGKFMWNHSFRSISGQSFQDGCTALQIEAMRSRLTRARGHFANFLSELPGQEGPVMFSTMAAHWVHWGCPSVMVGDRYASSLALTSASLEIEVNCPWPSFSVAWKPGLLPIVDTDGRTSSVERALVSHIPDKGVWNIVGLGKGVMLWDLSVPTDRLKEDTSGIRSVELGPAADGVDMDANDARVMMLVRRIVVGVCLDFASREPAESSALVSRERSVDFPPPATRQFYLGKAIEHDFSLAVREYCKGKSAQARNANWIVRGHWRNQACGAGLSDRKVIWIAPHWGNNKAGIDAPILSNEKAVDR